MVALRYSPKSKKVQQQLDQRARWVLKEWERSPTYKYADMIAAIRERFDIGHTMAEVAYARARELFTASTQDLDMTRLIAEYFKIYELAVDDKKWNAACRILNSLALNTGLAASRKHDVTVGGSITVNQIAHVSSLQLTPIQRTHREAELLAKAALAPTPDQIASAIDALAIPVDDADEEVDDEIETR